MLKMTEPLPTWTHDQPSYEQKLNFYSVQLIRLGDLCIIETNINLDKKPPKPEIG